MITNNICQFFSGAYEDDKFKTMLPKWQDGIDTGKTDTESLIAFSESKYTLSADQIDRINQMAPIAGETA
ncbi:RecT protein [Pseudomonas syringae pv. atrofaciens]|nr:hypothetical protein HM80_12025 [Pseudomonas syringae pv. syringae]KPW12309.1 RecT protein [Pseudomonas syringae pv. atrofaciens]